MQNINSLMGSLTLKYLGQTVLLALLYFILGKLSFALAVSHNNITSVIFAAEGVALAFVIIFGARVWPGIFIGQLVLALSTGLPLSYSLIISAGNSAEAVIGAWLFKRLNLKKDFSRSRDTLLFIILIVIVLQPFSATVGAVPMVMGGHMAASDFATAWLYWWTGNSMGQLLLGSFLLCWLQGKYPQFDKNDIRDSVFIAVIFVALSTLIFGEHQIKIFQDPIFIFILYYPLLTWAAIRFGPRGATLISLATAIVTLVATVNNLGPFSEINLEQRHIELNVFIAGGMLTALFIASTFKEHYHTEQELLKTQERLRLTIEGAAEGTWDWDILTNEVYYSKGFKELLGYSDEEFPNQFSSFEACLYPDDHERVFAAINEHLNNHVPYDIEFRLLAKSGNYRWIHARGQSLWDESGKAIRMAGSNMDITSRKIAENQLRESEARIHAIVDTVVDCIIIIDDKGVVISVNRSTEMLFGYRSHELIGQNINILVPAPHHDKHDGYIGNYISTGHAKVINRGREIYGRRKDETEFPIELTVSEVNLEGKRFFTGVLRDISERKEAEKKLLDYRDHLQEMVDAQTLDLIEARDDALAAERAMSGFLANMSHELRTPLHGILSYARFGKKKITTVSQDKLLQYFTEINDSGERLLTLLSDLLDLSKLRAGKMVYEFNEDDICQLTEAVISEFSVLAKEKNTRIQFQCLTEKTVALIDHAKISQVVRNLLSNALKYSPTDSTIEVDINHDGDNFIVTVSDEGVGIPDDELADIFDAFKQSSKTDTGAGGTGLGLAICKEIIEEGHKGHITARNKAEGGACLTFTLPQK